ncbi:MAG: DUF1512 domain-containing protein [Thaumarchaeota archaeon]|nr:DUF1512 domain-containing protein [Nitrososphaerota archaeon]
MVGFLAGLDVSTIVSLASFGLFFVFIVYGGKIQTFTATGAIMRSLNRLESMKSRARAEVISYLDKNGSGGKETTERVDEFLNYVTIMPVTMDPNGIVPKLEHLVDTSDERIRQEVRSLMKGSDPVSQSVAQNLIEMASGLTLMHKIVRHYYLEGKRTNSSMTLMQLQMSLPQIMAQAETISKAMASVELGNPIGDGVGPMVAAKFSSDGPKQLVAKDTVVWVTAHEGRTLYVMKAEGPMGYVGQPGLAMERLVDEMKVTPNAIIMVDAAAKLEGEETGEVAEGMGAAIGGIGVEKYQIEEVAAKHRIPVYAVLVKEGDIDVMATMKEEIVKGAEKAAAVVKRLIREKTKEGDTVLLAGIGNTLGVGQ